MMLGFIKDVRNNNYDSKGEYRITYFKINCCGMSLYTLAPIIANESLTLSLVVKGRISFDGVLFLMNN